MSDGAVLPAKSGASLHCSCQDVGHFSSFFWIETLKGVIFHHV